MEVEAQMEVKMEVKMEVSKTGSVRWAGCSLIFIYVRDYGAVLCCAVQHITSMTSRHTVPITVYIQAILL